MDIFKRLRIIINEQDISISRFEKEIGVGNNTICTILRKESGISQIILEKIKLEKELKSFYNAIE